MGYESRLYVVEKFHLDREVDIANEEKSYASIVGMIDLCGCEEEFLKIREFPETDCYIYVDGKQCYEDKYSEPLKEATIDETLALLHKGYANSFKYYSNGYGYRRYQLAISMLEGFKLADMCSDNIVVLHYGY